jgi:hypothetical protein
MQETPANQEKLHIFAFTVKTISAILASFSNDLKQFKPFDEFGEMDEWFKSHAWKACVGS